MQVSRQEPPAIDDCTVGVIGQLVQGAPDIDDVPAGQLVQGPPNPSDDVPAGQLVQTVLPSGKYCPGGQTKIVGIGEGPVGLRVGLEGCVVGCLVGCEEGCNA